MAITPVRAREMVYNILFVCLRHAAYERSAIACRHCRRQLIAILLYATFVLRHVYICLFAADYR